MNEWMIKTFYKDKAVKAVVAYPDKRIKTHWAIPENNTITINGFTYLIKAEDMMLGKGTPTFVYTSDSAEPINLMDLQKSLYTAEDFDTAISAKVAREILQAIDGKANLMMLAVGASVLSIIAVGAVWYTLNETLTHIMTKLDEIMALIKLIGGLA
jgi:hypothetical protein